MSYEETPHFLHLGEHPILDFCNTLIFHKDTTEDRMLNPTDAHNFYCEFFQKNQKFDAKNHAEVLEVRKELRRFFSKLITNPNTLKQKDMEYPLFKKYPVYILLDEKLNLTFKTITIENKFIEPLITSFHNFMIIFKIDRLKKCKNQNCSHFFYDRSKNNTRNWCSMKSCGNIMKARAFYKRSKK